VGVVVTLGNGLIGVGKLHFSGRSTSVGQSRYYNIQGQMGPKRSSGVRWRELSTPLQGLETGPSNSWPSYSQ